ncbi:MAG: transposase [Sphingomonadaceae bacterium]
MASNSGKAHPKRIHREVGFAALRVNGRMRDELINEALLTSFAHVRPKIAAWVVDYNTGRRHSALGYATPV